MKFCLRLCVLLLPALSLTAQTPPAKRGPVIDMHLHALPVERFGPPGTPNPATGKPSAATTDDQVREASLAALERYNIVLAVTSGTPELVRQWEGAAPNRIIASLVFPAFPEGGWPDLAWLRAAYQTGELQAMGELALQYQGLTLSSPEMEPYLALAEELDIPVAVHTGFGPPGAPYDPSSPNFRAALGNPLLIEEALVRHPKLRVYIMHAGFPFLGETIALVHSHPRVYVDLAVIDWVLSRAEFHAYLKALMQHTECGLPKRLMFGSDQMVWPEAIGMAIDNIEAADFLTEEQKRDLFCRNAARFLRLDPKTCE